MQQQELQMEDKLIQQLTRDESQWTLREDIKTEDDLWDNFFTILQNNNRAVLNGVSLTANEKASIKAQINHSTFFKAAQDFTGANGQYRITIQRDDTTVGTINLMVIDQGVPLSTSWPIRYSWAAVKRWIMTGEVMLLF